MTYELAKQLKDAGLPQKGKGEKQYFIDGKRIMTEFALQGECVYFPTLSELIEACGVLYQLTFDKEARNWTAQSFATSFNLGFFAEGSTPEEAVARLWLALHNSA